MLGLDYGSVDDNRSPDFAAAYAYGIRFAIVRGAYTQRGVQGDATVARDRAAAKAAGLRFGAYLILGWSDDPVAQVAKFVEVYGDARAGELPPALDIEFPGGGITTTGLTPAAALTRIETAVTELTTTYATVMIYTSARVWREDLGNIASALCGTCPVWLKVAYPWRERQDPHPESIPALGAMPAPWAAAGSPGAFIEQFQGDALRVPGFSSSVDLNVFRNYVGDTADARTAWIRGRLAGAGFASGEDASSLAEAVRAFQTASQLDADGVVGLDTWTCLCAAAPPSA